jgi:hypothetical protein
MKGRCLLYEHPITFTALCCSEKTIIKAIDHVMIGRHVNWFRTAGVLNLPFFLLFQVLVRLLADTGIIFQHGKRSLHGAEGH